MHKILNQIAVVDNSYHIEQYKYICISHIEDNRATTANVAMAARCPLDGVSSCTQDMVQLNDDVKHHGGVTRCELKKRSNFR